MAGLTVHDWNSEGAYLKWACEPVNLMYKKAIVLSRSFNSKLLAALGSREIIVRLAQPLRRGRHRLFVGGCPMFASDSKTYNFFHPSDRPELLKI